MPWVSKPGWIPCLHLHAMGSSDLLISRLISSFTKHIWSLLDIAMMSESNEVQWRQVNRSNPLVGLMHLMTSFLDIAKRLSGIEEKLYLFAAADITRIVA